MKSMRLQRLSGQLLLTRSGVACAASPARNLPAHSRPEIARAWRRHQSSAAAAISNSILDDTHTEPPHPPPPPPPPPPASFPSPLPEKARSSAKLAALHARLSLPQKIPLETLARSLVDVTADDHPNFNNANLAYLGSTLINYHVSEWIMCRYPRLPMMIIYAALKAYAGPKSLHQIARQWGVECAAAPGDEVDPGLLQFDMAKERPMLKSMGYTRPEVKRYTFKWRHGVSGRVVMDDDFGDTVGSGPGKDVLDGAAAAQETALNGLGPDKKREIADNVHADFLRATVGAVYAHCGRDAVKAFINAHILSRQLDFASLFQFKLPTHELATLCAREGFEKPVARLISETGRMSRTPVFVVGIFSGNDKLGEAAAANLDQARMKASINALKAWYLYSPGENARLPSDMLVEGAKPWQPTYIDIGEVVCA